jgi:hypothetical protein
MHTFAESACLSSNSSLQTGLKSGSHSASRGISEKSTQIYQEEVFMRIYLDNTAWLSLVSQGLALDLLREGQERGSIEITLSVENLRELIIKESVGEDRRARNLFAIAPFLKNFEADRLLVIGHSRLGFAHLPESKVSDVYDSHLNGKSKPEKAIADGIHIANAVALDAELVSCDHQVRMTALKSVRNLRCLRQMIDELGGSIIGLDACSCPISQH